MTHLSSRRLWPVSAFTSLTVVCTFLVLSASAWAETRSATFNKQGLVYRDPDSSSEVLGHLREGKQIKVEVPDQNGWYSVSFARPIKGANVGWVQASDVDLDGGGEVNSPPAHSSNGRPQKRTSKASSRLKNSWFQAGADINLISPSTFQTTIGEANAGITQLSYALEYGHFLSPYFALAFKGYYYSFSAAETTVTNGTYSSKGYGLQVQGDVAFVRGPNFWFGAGLGIGAGLNTAGNVGQAFQYSTSNILSYPITIDLILKKFFGSVGISGDLGYKIESLSAVPVDPESDPNGTANTTADLSMSGLFFNISLALQF